MAGRRKRGRRAAGPATEVSQPHAFARLIQSVTGPWTRENLFAWIKLAGFVLAVWWLFLQPFRIPSGSMEPTLHGDPGFFKGDRVFVNKLVFGVRIPFTNIPLFRLGDPRRWDVVVFRSVEPEAPHKVLIKRVVGLPGDRIRIEDGRVLVNGEPLELPESMPDVYYTDGIAPTRRQIEEIVEEAPRDQLDSVLRNLGAQYVHYRETKPFRYGILPDDEYAVVPEDHYLMLGDNSANSVDGRYFGWVPHNHLLGRAFCIWWPVGHRRDLTGFTRAWWGMALLIGIPGLLIGYEISRSFFWLPWRVRGASFGDAAADGEHVLIDRLAFGLRLPFSSLRVVSRRGPGRGDQVAYSVAALRQRAGGPAAELVCGHVAGLPGETVRVVDGVILVGDKSTGIQALPPRLPDGAAPGEGAKGLSKKPSTIPEGHYLILTAAESDAPDSRTLGWVPFEALVGRVVAVWWPPHKVRRVSL